MTVDSVDSFLGEWEVAEMRDNWHMAHLVEACAGSLQHRRGGFLQL